VSMNDKLARLRRALRGTQLDARDIQQRTSEIHQRLQQQSDCIRDPNFTSIHPQDLRTLFNLYDERFLQNNLRSAIGDTPLRFRLSRRMTSVGGKTVRYSTPVGVQYEICLSATLLFQSFHDVNRPIVVTGLKCQDRLQALQRIFEHEILHLAEMLVWTNSNCAARRFRSMAQGLFGHTHHQHALVTQRERASSVYGIRPGDRVRFRFDGMQFEGLVNRIHRRATVLVEHSEGLPYSDGRRYRKFYVPLQQLEPAANEEMQNAKRKMQNEK